MFQPGDIGFVHNGALISRIISWAMGSKWSHTFMVVGEIQGVTMVIETSDFQVTLNTLDRYLDGRPVAIFRPTLDGTKAARNSFTMLGQVYGYLQLLSLGLRRLLMKFNLKIDNFIRIGIVCCAVPLYAYQDQLNIDPESVDTEELYQLIKEKFELIY